MTWRPCVFIDIIEQPVFIISPLRLSCTENVIIGLPVVYIAILINFIHCTNVCVYNLHGILEVKQIVLSE